MSVLIGVGVGCGGRGVAVGVGAKAVAIALYAWIASGGNAVIPAGWINEVVGVVLRGSDGASWTEDAEFTGPVKRGAPIQIRKATNMVIDVPMLASPIAAQTDRIGLSGGSSGAVVSDRACINHPPA